MLKLKLTAEIGGIKNTVIDGIRIQASGKSTCGRECKLIQERISQVDQDIHSIQKRIKEQQSSIKTIETPYTEEIKQLKITHRATQKEQAKIYKNSKQDFIQKQKSSMKSKIKQLKESIQEKQEQLKELKKNREKDINHYTQKMMQSPEFVKFRDGPITRMMAVEDLHKDQKYGEMMFFFSMIVKAFIIFLEIVPIIAKMFFSPPSVYGAILQQQAREGVRRFSHSLR